MDTGHRSICFGSLSATEAPLEETVPLQIFATLCHFTATFTYEERGVTCVAPPVKAILLGDWAPSHEQSALFQRPPMCTSLHEVLCHRSPLPELCSLYHCRLLWGSPTKLHGYMHNKWSRWLVQTLSKINTWAYKAHSIVSVPFQLWVGSANRKRGQCTAAASFHQPYNSRWSNQGARGTDQGWEPNPYHASWRIWKPRPSRIVFLFPIDRIRIPKTTVWKGQTLIRFEPIVNFDIKQQKKSQNKN